MGVGEKLRGGGGARAHIAPAVKSCQSREVSSRIDSGRPREMSVSGRAQAAALCYFQHCARDALLTAGR